MKLEDNEILEENYYRLLDEIRDICNNKLNTIYDIDKVKDYAVYVWTKGGGGSNVFDIQADMIVYYEDHDILEGAIPIILEIQKKLFELDEIFRIINQSHGEE
jgi:hypothetical protein